MLIFAPQKYEKNVRKTKITQEIPWKGMFFDVFRLRSCVIATFYVPLQQETWIFSMQMVEANEALVAILKKSHEQAMNGEAVKMDEAERFIQDKVYELTSPVDAYCVAEPFWGFRIYLHRIWRAATSQAI